MSVSLQPGASPLRVVIADDNRDAADLLAALLKLSLQVETTVVYDGYSALERALALKPHVALLDLQMPGLDGTEVARRIRSRFGRDGPYLIAVTGCADAVHDLASIDAHFDRAFAKPLDADELIATLGHLAAGESLTPRRNRSIDLADVLTRVARQVVPIAAAQGIAFSFDYAGPSVIVVDDPVEIHCAFHRLLLGVLEIVPAGFVLYSARVDLRPDGRCYVTIDAAATGEQCEWDQTTSVFHRLGLVDAVDPESAAALQPDLTTRYAEGICRNTGARLSAWIDAHEGVLVRAQLSYDGVSENEAASTDGAGRARAWLIDGNALPLAWGERRLLDWGWNVLHFASCRDALDHLHLPPPDGKRSHPLPALLVVVESPGSYRDSDALQAALPPTVQRIFAVMAGSPTLGAPHTVPAFDVRTLPFSPLELADICEAAAPSSRSRSGMTLSAPLGQRPRPRVLLVDDNHVNRIVGSALLDSIGYEVRTAHDGLDAIDQCRRWPPQAVLMDLDMPVLKGLDATVRLRELQRLGDVPPFAILAATADDTAQARAACAEVGMDGFLTKPLDIQTLRQQMRRFTGGAPQRPFEAA